MREKLGASVFLGFGILTLALGIDGLLTKYDQGGFVTWGIVLIFGLIFALAGVVLLLNTINAVPERVKQLLGHIIGGLVFLLFGAVGIFVDGLGIMRVILIFFGVIGVLIVIQGIRVFMNKDATDKTSGIVHFSNEIGGDADTAGYNSVGSNEDMTGYSGYEIGQTGMSYEKGTDPLEQTDSWQNETPGTPFSGSADNKVYTSQVNHDGTEYRSGMSPEFNQMMTGMGMNSDQQEKMKKVGSVVRKGANIYAGVICIVIGSGFVLVNSIFILSFIIMLIRTASLMSIMSSLFSTVMSVALLIIGVFMIVRGVKILQGKI